MDLLITLAAFLFALGVIVFVHELGHYLVAKLFGVRVLTFSLGFGKRLWGFRRRGTDYRISLVPLGGYVRMGGELPDEGTGDPGEFLSKSRWQRVLVYLAGPAMNVALAIALIAAVFMAGIEMQALQELPAVVGSVADGSAAAAAGLAPGDRILALGGAPVAKWKDVQFAFSTSPGRPVEVDYLRGGQRRRTVLTPAVMPRYGYGDAGVFPKISLRVCEVTDEDWSRAGFRPGDEPRVVDGRPMTGRAEIVDYLEESAGVEVRIEVRRGDELLTIPVTPAIGGDGKGRVGFELAVYRRLPFGEAVVESVRYNVDVVDKSLQILAKLFTREISAKSSLSGPIEIAAISGQAARRGWKDLLFVMGFLSISIGFMNLLPIPVLDGGHVAILAVEGLLRRDMSILVKERLTQVGFMMLMTLMAVVIFFDFAKSLGP
jgi:regulator of sigma E protease